VLESRSPVLHLIAICVILFLVGLLPVGALGISLWEQGPAAPAGRESLELITALSRVSVPEPAVRGPAQRLLFCDG